MRNSDLYFLYDQVIESLTRLHSFAAMRVRDLDNSNDVEDDVDHVAELLLRRDLLTFAASTRNFAEASSATKEMRTIGIPTCQLLPPPVKAPFFTEGAETITLYQALSRILHSSSIKILRSARDYDYQAAASSEALLDIIGRRARQKPERSAPLILLKGERDPATILRVRSIVLRSCAYLNGVSDRLSEERSIYLQREFRDL
ncbi:hypothetical protein AAE026_29390 [Bradyrhizobium sp. DN5]|uniref:hypothetical protein n=1 Tax=Bradyrhizobium sp. DN5 TaxID=3056950 RepID=UPI003526A94D